MKYTLFFLLIPYLLSAQVADTVYLESVTDSTWRVVRQVTYVSGAQDVRKTEELDSLETVTFLINQIHDNELVKVGALRNIINTSDLDALYFDINDALDTVSGQGFLPAIWPFVSDRYVGHWQLTDAVDTVYAAVTAGRLIVETTAACSETPEPSGFSGAFWGVTRNSFIPKNFLPIAKIPDGERFVSETAGADTYRAINSAVIFIKLTCP